MKFKTVEWSVEEILKLQKLQRKFKREWSIINKLLNQEFNSNRTSSQCRYQFNKINQVWKQKEIELLIFKRLSGTEWEEIVELFPGKNEKKLKAKYNSLIDTDTFQRITKQLNKQYQQEIEIKKIEYKLTVEEIPSFKFKHWYTPDLPNIQKSLKKGIKVILNDFKV